jgi:hypothetical protein
MSVRFLALVCSAFLLFISSAFAQSVPRVDVSPVSYPVSTIRNVSTLGAYSVGPSDVPKHAFAHAIGGLVDTSASSAIRLPDGRRLPVVVQGQIPKADVSGAIGRFARKALPVLATGVALYDLAQELGFNVDNSSGELVVQKPAPGYCPTGPCYQWRYLAGVWYGTPQAAAQSVVGTAISDCPLVQSVSVFAVGVGHPNYGFNAQCYYGPGNVVSRGPYGLTSGSRAVDTVPNYAPSSLAELEAAIASKSGWPSGSALSRATVDAIKSGESLTVTPQTVSGPATSPGPVTQTVNNTNNTTTTSTTTHNHSYSGPNVTTTTTTTTVTINNTTNEVIDSSTTTTEPVMPESSDEDEGVPTDTALGEVPQLYEPKYPDGIVGVWNAKKAELLDTSFMDTLSQLMPNVGSVGTCPVWILPLDFEFFDAGDVDVSVPCWLWDFAKVVIIVSALLLARAIIFGG